MSDIVTVVVLNLALRPAKDGIMLHGYIEGDAAERLVTCCINVADGEALAQYKYDNPGETVTAEIDRRWLIPVLIPQEAVA